MPDISTYTEYGTTYDICDARNRSELEQIKEFIGYVDNSRIAGLCVDFENYEFTRLAGAVGKSAGSDFDVFPMYGGRRLCNLADDGTVNAWYGESGYTEDGSNGQVMVWQPKFYYKVVPLKTELIQPEVIDDTTTPPTYDEPEGYHLLKANYYVTDIPITGFKIHPAFLATDGITEMDGVFISAYEGSVYDVSESKYLIYDDLSDDGNYTASTYVLNANTDKLSSLAGVKPLSAKNQPLKHSNIEKMCQNRGLKWHGENLQVLSMEQMLMVIECGAFNMREIIGYGVCMLYEGSAVQTGATSSIGNGTGISTKTDTYTSQYGHVEHTYSGPPNLNWQMSVRYRGRENDWGNVDKIIDGINIYSNGKQKSGIVYYCNDYVYELNKTTGNYISTNITICNPTYDEDYIDCFGYSSNFDWGFIPTKTNDGASSVLPVGSPFYGYGGVNAYRELLIGGGWGTHGAGIFLWNSCLTIDEINGWKGARIMCLGPTPNS